MPTPSSIADLSVTAASNYPAGSENRSTIDDYHRALSAIVRREQAKGANVASASTVNIGAVADGSFIHITGVTTITAFDTVSAGVERVLVFDGVLTLTHNATSLILPGGANITTAANDVAVFRSEGSGNWRCISYQPSSAFFSSAITGVTSINGGQLAGFRNRIINGSFDVWQRGTSIAHGSDIFVADRWRGEQSSGTGDYTTSRQSVSTGEPFTYCARIARGTTSTATSYFYQAVESVNSQFAKGKYLTLSFYARKGSGYSGANLQAHIYSGTGTDQGTPHVFTGAVDNATVISAATLTTSFQRFTVTTSAALATTTNQIGVSFNTSGTGSPSNDYIEIAGVQVEEGSTATAFEHRPYGTELALCQRYYQTTGRTLWSGNATSGGTYWLNVRLPVSLRTAATIGNTTITNQAASGFPSTASTFNAGSTDYIEIQRISNSSVTAGYFVDSFTVNAEL